MSETTLSALPRTGDRTDKQFLLHLQESGAINNVQLRAIARRYEEVHAKLGPGKALDAVLREFDAGEVEMDQGAANRAKPPTLGEAPEDDSPKTTLLWLHGRGTLTMDQVRQAASVLLIEPTRDLGDVLHEIGARSAFTDDEWEEYEVPESEPVKEDETILPDLGSTIVGEFSADQRAAAEHILTHPIATLKPLLEQISSLAVLDCLVQAETAGQNRKGALDAIEDRAVEVMGTMNVEHN